MAFKLSIVSDVRSWLKGTQDIEQSLDKLAGSLDELAADTKTNADQAATALTREFTDSFEKVKTEAKTAGKKVGDEMHDGTRRATSGVDDFKGEAKSSIRETAASFSDVTDALDLVQEVAANAFEGFGPAGMAAGAAAAIGIGLVKASLDAAKEKADDTVEMIHGIATALRDSGGAAGFLADSMSDIVDEKEWYEFWQNLPVDRLTSWSQAVKDLGLSYDDIFQAASGDVDALARIHEQAGQRMTEANMDSTTTFLQNLNQQNDAMNAAKRWNEEYANSTVAAQRQVEEAQQHAADVSKAWGEALADHLSVADEGLDQFVKDGQLNLRKWADAVKERAKDVARVEDFKVDVFPKLSPEAQEAFAQLPTETQTQIAKAYEDGSKKDRKKIRETLEAEVDVKATVKDTDVPAVSIPTKVDAGSAVTGTRDAADAAQKEADKDGNEVTIRTRIDQSDLQHQVDRAAAAITPPTIYVTVKAKKENP